MITQQYLKEILNYDPETGIFTWVVKKTKSTKVGHIAGCKKKDGYTRITIDKNSYLAHRLAWLYVYGEFPKFDIDHKDHNKSNNRISNLRDVTRSINMQNRMIAQKNNKSGMLGVHFKKSHNKFGAQIVLCGKKIHLGYFDTQEQAHDAYITKKRMHHEGNLI